MPNTTLTEFVDAISTKISLEINPLDKNKPYLEELRFDNADDARNKACLEEIEEYLAKNNCLSQLDEEFKKLSFHVEEVKVFPKPTKEVYSIQLDAYKNSPLIKLLHIRALLIVHSLNHNFSGRKIQVETGSWVELSSSIVTTLNLRTFYGKHRNKQDVDEASKEMVNQLNQVLASTKTPQPNTKYFAFHVSNSVYTEPYILKISNGLIEELLCSTAEHTSTDMHSHLAAFIKANNPNCKTHATLPLVHDGDCTRKSTYALLQFMHLSRLHGSDKAYHLLCQQNPYPVDKQILRDFQMLAWHCDYDPFEKTLCPLSIHLNQEFEPNRGIFTSNAQPAKPDQGNPGPKPRQNPAGTPVNLDDFTLWLNKLKEKRDNLHARYPEQEASDTNTAYGASSLLVSMLDRYVEQYKKGSLTPKQFKDSATRDITANYTGVLGQHRGIKEILVNLLFALGTLGVGYALAALFTQSLTPIQCNTDTVDILIESEDVLMKIA